MGATGNISTSYTAADVRRVRDVLRSVLNPMAPRFHWPAGDGGCGFLAAAERHRVLVFLSERVGQLDIPDELRDQIAAAGKRDRMAALGVVREQQRALAALQETEIDVLVLKGTALATQAYGEFAARGSGDIDLLVRPKDVLAAREALIRAGWHPDPRFPSAGENWSWAHLLRNGYELPMYGRGASVDLHWHLDPAHGAFADFDVLWDRRDEVHVGGKPLFTLSPSDALAHSANHAAKDEWAWLRSILDVAVMLNNGVRPSSVSVVQSETFTVVGDCLGVAVEGAHKLGRGRARRVVRRAHNRQTRSPEVVVNPVPGIGTLRSVLIRSRAAAGWKDVRRIAFSAIVPPNSLGGIDSSRASSALRVYFRQRIVAAARRRRAPGSG